MQNTNLPYFIKSCNNIKQIPYSDLKNVLIAGRSNVGKSSLINAIAKTKLAKTSKSPGCTKSLNFFNFYNKFILIDMPGYGYARVSLNLRNEWNDFIYSYLSLYKISITMVLIDSKVGFKQTDLQMINLLKSLNIKYIVIFTKADKVHKFNEEMLKSSFEILKDNYDYIITSQKDNLGINKVLGMINAIEK